MKLKTLDTFVLREVKGPFFFGVLAFTLIMVAGGLLFKLADLIIDQGVPLTVAFRLFVYQLPSVVTLTLPMSCLLGCLLGFGTLASHSEIVALKASGVSFARVARPVLVASALVSVVAFLMSEVLVPIGAKGVQQVMTKELMAARPTLLQQGVFIKIPNVGDDQVLYIDQLEGKEGLMEGVVIQRLQGGRLVGITTARQGLWKNGTWQLSDGAVYDVNAEGLVVTRLTFESQVLALNLSPTQLAKSTQDPDDLSARALYDHIKVIQAQGRPVNELWVDFHLKFALPLSCIFMALVGATVGARGHRRGGASVGFGQSVLIVFVYYLVMTLGRSLGGAGKMPALLAAWLPNLLFACASWWLVRRAD